MEKLIEFSELVFTKEFLPTFDQVKFAHVPGEKMKHGSLYVYEAMESQKMLMFSCPCGCGRLVNIPIKNGNRDGWVVSINNEALTVNPSVYSKSFPCKSHYFIKNNSIRWC